MEIKQCAFGHFYDASVHSHCPYCGNRADVSPDPAIIRLEALNDAPSDDAPSSACAREEVRPVVGWLVCVKGPDLGRSYEIHDNNNFVGHGGLMDINIRRDPGLPGDRSVVVTYDSRSRAFFCGLINGRELVRLNGSPLLSASPLRPGDRLEISRTELMLVPLCGPDFDWDWDSLPR